VADRLPDRMDAETLVAIGEACALTGLSPRTVRYYEEVGLLEGVRRQVGGRRVYASQDIERLRFIQRLKALGLSLGEIKDLSAIYAIAGSTRAMLEKLEDLLSTRLSDLDSRIAELMTLRDDMSKYRDHVDARIASLRRDRAEESQS
jgi:DNA-binding transcriptional MerR regulator